MSEHDCECHWCQKGVSKDEALKHRVDFFTKVFELMFIHLFKDHENLSEKIAAEFKEVINHFLTVKDSKGDDVEISHPDSLFKFVITKRRYNNIISLTERPGYSVPFGLELFTKCGIHVANLCVYAKDTPMLDQLFMIAMYVKSGNEEDLLRKANFSCIMQDQELKEIIVSEVDYLGPKLLGRNSGIYFNAGEIGSDNIVQGRLPNQ